MHFMFQTSFFQLITYLLGWYTEKPILKGIVWIIFRILYIDTHVLQIFNIVITVLFSPGIKREYSCVFASRKSSVCKGLVILLRISSFNFFTLLKLSLENQGIILLFFQEMLNSPPRWRRTWLPSPLEASKLPNLKTSQNTVVIV